MNKKDKNKSVKTRPKRGMKDFYKRVRAGELKLEEAWKFVPGLKKRWETIYQMFIQRRVLETKDLMDEFKIGLKEASGIWAPLVRLDAVVGLPAEKERAVKSKVYFCSLPKFYGADELQKKIPDEFQQEILKRFMDRNMSLEELSKALRLNLVFTEEVLKMFVSRKALKKSGKIYSLESGIYLVKEKKIKPKDRALRDKIFSLLVEKGKVKLSEISDRLMIKLEKAKELLFELKEELKEANLNLLIDGEEISISSVDFIPDQPSIFKVNNLDINPEEETVFGVYSCINEHSPNFRSGLIEKAYRDYFAPRGIQFIILVSGLVVGRNIEEEINRMKKKGQTKEELRSIIASETASRLSKIIPVLIGPNGKKVKTYFTSALQLDGKIGSEISRHLSQLRPEDLVYKGQNNNGFVPTRTGRRILPISPNKSMIPGKFASTNTQNLLYKTLKIVKKETDLAVLGGFGVNVFKPSLGDSSINWITAPMLNGLESQETPRPESEIGCSIVTMTKDDVSVEFVDFKHLVAQERWFIKNPPSVNALQKKILGVLKEDGPSSPGILEDEIGIDRHEIEQEINSLNQTGFGKIGSVNLGIQFDKSSKQHEFSPELIQWGIKYPSISLPKIKKTKIAYIGCTHIGAMDPNKQYVITDFHLISKILPKKIIENDVEILFHAGDGIQGSPKRHDYTITGQLFPGMGVLQQEEVAGYLMAKVISDVFDFRLKKFISENPGVELNRKTVNSVIEKSLLYFVFCSGNHDQWQEADGVTALMHFRMVLERYLEGFISESLGSVGLRHDLSEIKKLLNRHIIQDHEDQDIRFTKNGIRFKDVHPFTGRNLTVSKIPEDLISHYRLADVVVAANWHLASQVVVSVQGKGFQVAFQVPASLGYTKFENNKIKNVDCGFGITEFLNYYNSLLKKSVLFSVKTEFVGRSGIGGKENTRFLIKTLKDLGIAPAYLCL